MACGWARCWRAVQFLRAEPGDLFSSSSPESSIRWLNDDELQRRIELLIENHGSTRLAGDGGQLSLAGAQPKLALHRHPASGAWGVPEGNTPRRAAVGGKCPA
jgi:serine/threonine-protein kinase HipA